MADLVSTLLTDLQQSFAGKQYVWGQLDCSALVQQAYAMIGISLPRTSSQQWSVGTPVDLSALQPGDLVFYAPGTNGAPAGQPGHVAIYVGNGQVFQALNPNTPIGTPAPVNQDWASPMGARRVIGVVGGGGTSLAASGSTAPSIPQVSQTVATGSGSTCAFALGTRNKILIWNVNISICIIDKTELRALIGALMIAGGAGITMVGMALVLRYALDKSGTTSAIVRGVETFGMVMK